MTTAVDCGAERLRDIRGECCDLCGDVCHPDAEILVAISCGRCDSLIYHQGCVEKFLKKHGFESNRKTGFPCPRGRGKATRFSDECKGRIDKSHPIIPRNEEKKKKSLAPPINEVLAKQAKAKPDMKVKQQQQAKPSAMPRKAKPTAQQAAATVLRASAPVRTPSPLAANVWHQAGASSAAVREAPVPVDPAAMAAAAAAAAELEQPKQPHVPVGLVLEEALSKAQKKNLQRRKKKQEAAGGDGHSEAGTAATDASSVDGWNDGANGGSNGGASSSMGTTAGAAALLSSNSFVTDIKRYQQLLGLYVGGDDSDDDVDDPSDDGDHPASDVSSSAAPAALTRPGSSSSYSSASTPPEAAATEVGGSDFAAASTDDDAALAAVMEQSRREYELQQEEQRQRDILSGCGAGPLVGTMTGEPPVALPAFSVPVAQPVHVPTPVPVFVPVAEPQPAPAHVSFAGLAHQQQPTYPRWQQEASLKSPAVNVAAGYGGYGVQQAAAYGVVPMAAGHGMAAAGAGDDEDELDSLLALCGVAG